MRRFHQLLPALVLWAVVAAPLSAEQKPDEKQLTVRPAPLPSPALKYRFTVAPEDQVPGNAATAYLMAITAAQVDSRMDELFEAPLSDLKKSGAQDFLAKQSQAVQQVEMATRLSECDWGSSFRQQGFAATFGYLNQCRWIANVLTIQARLQIAEGHCEDAAKTLREGFVLGDNLTHEAPLVQSLIAIAIDAAMLNDATQMMQARNAPNLYWALANLRRPMVDTRKVIETEAAGLFFSFPDLKDHPERLPAEKSRELFARVAAYGRGSATPGDVAFGLAQMVKVYPRAKQWLVGTGLPQDQVDNLAANSVVLAYEVEQYKRQTQEFLKWGGLPAWEAIPGMRRAADQLVQARQEFSLVAMLTPAYQRIGLQSAKLHREVAAMMCVESIRAYAAAHNGAAPPDLDALSPDTPAPLDPMLGKPFEYQAKENVVTLRGAAPEWAEKQFEMIFRVTLEH